MTHTEMTHHFPSSLCVRCKLLFLLNPNSHLTYNTSWFASSLRCLSNRAKRQPTKIYRNPLQSLQVFRWLTFTPQSDFWTDLCGQSCPMLLLPELKVCSGQIKSIQARGERLCQVTFTSRSVPRKASHQSNQNNSSLPRLESSLLTTEPCTSSTPSLTALQFRLFELLPFVSVMSCFAKRDDGINLLPQLKLLN